MTRAKAVEWKEGIGPAIWWSWNHNLLKTVKRAKPEGMVPSSLDEGALLENNYHCHTGDSGMQVGITTTALQSGWGFAHELSWSGSNTEINSLDIL